MSDLIQREAFEKLWASRDPRWFDWQIAALEKSRPDEGDANEHDHAAWRMWNMASVTLDTANARIADLEQELRNIANADTVAWDDPTEFEAWAKSRARHSLGALDKQQTQGE